MKGAVRFIRGNSLQSLLMAALLLVGIVLITSQVVSQEKSTVKEEEEAVMAEWMKYAMPGEHHKLLDPYVGSWTYTMQWWMAPNTEAQEFKGTCDTSWILDGRFLLQKVSGDMEGETFKGMGIMGFDNLKQQYTTMWIDNMSTAIMTNLGTCDPSGKVFTLTGFYDDAMSGKKNQKIKTVDRIVNENEHVSEMWITGPDGKEFKTGEIVYTRK